MTRRDDELPLSGRPRVDDDVRRELEFHIEQRAAELEAQGLSRERALAAARELFGDRTSVEAECRQIEQRRRTTRHRADRLAELRHDVVVGFRMLRRTPGFTLAAILTLALGIGANAAVFSIINRVVLQPLHYPEADRIVQVWERHDGGGSSNPSWTNFLDLQSRVRSFAAMGAYGSGTVTVLGAASPARVRGTAVSAGFFRVFGVRPALGRLPLPEEHALGATPVAVVSHAFWRDHLGAPPSLAGISLRMDRQFEVVGVLPEEFDYPDGSQIWAPLEIHEQSLSRTSHNWEAVARLRPGVSPEDAEREAARLFAQLKPIHYPDFDATGATVTQLQAALTDGMRTPLYMLFGASAILLLAACANLASAMLARGTARAAELAVRSALGATRVRLIRQLLTESALLAVLGAVAGLLLAALLLRALGLFAPASLHVERVRVDAWVQGFALLVAMVTTVLFGLLPALRLSDTNTGLALREGGRGNVGVGRMRAWNALVASEVALAVMLLAGSVLLIRSFAEVMRVDLGFDPRGVLMAEVNLPEVSYGDSGAVASFHERVLEQLRRVPGVQAAGAINVLPLASGNPSGAMEVEGKPHDERGPFTGYSIYRVVAGDYFRAMGLSVIEGRVFGPADDARAPAVVVVDQEFARREWPGQSAIGKRVRPAGMDMGEGEPWHTVIGVVGNVRASSIVAPFRQTYYFDHRQRPPGRTMSVRYAVRSSLPVGPATVAVRRAVAAVDPQVPVDARPMSAMVSRAVSDRRFTMLVLGAFASVALLLALVGIYAVVSYAVAQRTREIGVRLALGATAAEVRRLVMSSALRGIAPGLAVGALLAFVGVRALRSLVYGVSPFDPVALIAAIAILGLVGIASSVLPARRATRVDPLVAMRAE